MDASHAKLTVDILRPLADAKTPQHLEAARASLEERIVLASFVDAGFVDGRYRRDEKGVPSDFMNLTLTVAGRAHLAESEKKEADATSIGFVRNRAPKIIAWFFGILAAVAGAWLIKHYLS
jgi:hypothetical protein